MLEMGRTELHQFRQSKKLPVSIGRETVPYLKLGLGRRAYSQLAVL